MSNELSYLRSRLAGPILDIRNPKDHTEEEIIKSYFLEIVYIARKFVRPNVELSDLVDEGIMGLLDAIQRFDPDRANGNPKGFHNMAVVRIKSYLNNFLLRNSNKFYTPNYIARGLNYLNQVRRIVEGQAYEGDNLLAISNYSCKEFEESVPKDVAIKLRKCKDKIVKLASSQGHSYEKVVANLLDVEQNLEQYTLTLEEQEESVQTPEDLAGDRQFLETFLDTLTPTAKTVMSMSLQGYNFEEIGNNIGTSRQRAHQLFQETMEYLKKTTMYKRAVGE